MKNTLLEQFTEQLVQETVRDYRTWYPLQPPTEEMEKSNPPLAMLLFVCEFHWVDFDSSYMLPFENGFFFLINEQTESGRDGTVINGYNLYAQPNVGDEITLIAHDTHNLYRLKNAIEEKQEPPQSVISFIQSFLES